MAKIDIIVLPVLKDNYAYILHNNESGECAIIDPSVADEVIAFCDSKSWKLNYIVNTHHHWDHVGGNLELKATYGARIFGADADKHRIPGIDQTVFPGQDFDLLGMRWQVIDTPGHTIGHVAFYIPELKSLFCGDTLFGLGVGGIFEGTPAQMWQSLAALKSLPADTQIYCGHEYTLAFAPLAVRLEPDRKDIKDYIASVKQKRIKGEPSVPFLMQTERQFNPYLRADDPVMQELMGMPGAKAEEVFTRLYSISD